MNNREQSIINLVINGQQAQTSLREVTGTVNALRSELSRMRREDNPALYEERIRQLRQMSAAQAALRQEINSTGQEAQGFLAKIKGFFSGSGPVFSGNLLADAFSNGMAALKGFAMEVVHTYTEFEKLDIVLTNALGSKGASFRALNSLQKFAAETPFQLSELTESYVKLVNRGMQPTMAEMRAMGDLASSQGKSFDQLTEALLDAVTGEFERLKELGITAKKNGDMVSLSFKGMTVDVKNSAEAIKEALMNFGKMDGVADGMKKMSESVGGNISNMGDNWERVLTRMGQNTGGFTYWATNHINQFLSNLADAFMTTEQKLQEFANNSAADTMTRYNKMSASDKKALYDGNNIDLVKLKKELAEMEKRMKPDKPMGMSWRPEAGLEDRIKHWKTLIAEGEALKETIDSQNLNEAKMSKIRADQAARDAAAAAKIAADKAKKEAEKSAREIKTFQRNVKDTQAEVDTLIAAATKGTAGNLDAQLQVINNKYQKLVDKLKELSGSKYATDADRKGLGKDITAAGKLRDNEIDGAKAEFSYNSMEKTVNNDAQRQKNDNNNSELTPEEKAQQEYDIEQKRLQDLYDIRQVFGMDTLDLETLLADGKIKNDKRVADAHLATIKQQTKTDQDYARIQQQIADEKAQLAENGVALLFSVFGRSKGVMMAQLAVEKAIAVGRILAQEGIEIAAYYAQSVLQFGPIVGPGVASGLAAMAKVRSGLSIANIIASGLAQAVGITQGDSGGKKFANGGFAPDGPSHGAGGLKLVNPYGLILGEMEGGEPILSRSTYANNRGLVDALMSSGGRQLNLNRIQDATYNRERRLSNLSLANDDRSAASAAGVSRSEFAGAFDALASKFDDFATAVQSQPVIFSNRAFEESQNRRMQIKDEVNA
ncbi:tape measure protein [Mucilaginibacter sp. CSA2-8R]|uniref:tape measure protein n=1 Tax=Mucilaginibacter sp. CSA2-8R TaxID=3141542 RepID=UPI00315D313B